MAFDSNIYREVMNEYEQLRQREQAELDSRREEVYSALPRIRDIDSELREIGYSLSLKVISEPDRAEEVLEQLKRQVLSLNQEKAALLREHQYPDDVLKLHYECPQCRDTGYIENRQCICLKQKLIAKSYHLSNLERLFETQNFESFDFSYYSKTPNPVDRTSPYERIRSIYAVCREFVENFGEKFENLLFYGPPGIGKTFLSSCIAKEILDSGRTVIYESSFDLCSLYEDYKFMRIPAENAKARIDRMYDVDLLIIDDLGTEIISRTTTAFLFNLIDTRLRGGKSLIISTNQTVQELNKIYSQRLSSRIFEYFTQLEFLGTDIRLQKMLGDQAQS